MLNNSATQQTPNSIRRYRWAVWIDDHSVVVVTSRNRAKKLCLRAQERAYFCRCNPTLSRNEKPLICRISDFLIWEMDNKGKFFRYMYVRPANRENNATTTSLLGQLTMQCEDKRYAKALRNQFIWKLGSRAALEHANCYPVRFEEVTADSETAMVCAGYSCIRQFSTMSELHAFFSEQNSENDHSGTIENGLMKIWKICNY